MENYWGIMAESGVGSFYVWNCECACNIEQEISELGVNCVILGRR